MVSTVKGFRFDPSRYSDAFLAEDGEHHIREGVADPVARSIWCFWTGNNPLTPNRERALSLMREHNPIVLVTPDNLHEVEVEGHPYHPAYEHLSLVHRSDYLRAYVMHHYGGGYSDVKPHARSWTSAFDRLDAATSSTWAVGYPERSASDVAQLTGRLGRDLRLHHRLLIGLCGFIFRRASPFTSEWLNEVECRLTHLQPALEAHPGNLRGHLSPTVPQVW